MNNFFNGKSAAMMLALSLVNVTAAFAQDDNSSAKEEGNRNVMLNAALSLIHIFRAGMTPLAYRNQL